MIANLAWQLRELVANTDAAEKLVNLEKLAERYRAGSGMDGKELNEVVKNTFSIFLSEATVLNINVKQSTLFSKVSQWASVEMDKLEQDSQIDDDSGSQSENESAENAPHSPDGAHHSPVPNRLTLNPKNLIRRNAKQFCWPGFAT